MQSSETMSFGLPVALLILLSALSLPLAAASGSSYLPLLSNEVISTSPAPNSTLDISLTPMCESDDIVFRVTSHNQPVIGAEVELHHFQDGIHFEASTVTNSEGRSAFIRRPAGRYDLVARANNSTMGQIFFKIPPCISPPSGVGYGPVISGRPLSKPYATQTYASGLSREFHDFVLSDGRPATRVILRADNAMFKPNQSLLEQIPLSIASSERSVGFESDYPQQISLNASLVLSWERGSPQFERSYVIYRSLDSSMVQRFGSPALQDRTSLQPVNATLTNQTAAAPSAVSPPAQEASISPWAAAGLAVSAVFLGGYMLLKRKAGSEGASDKKSD